MKGIKTTTYSSRASRAGVLRCFTSLGKALTSPWCPHGATGIFLQIHGVYRALVAFYSSFWHVWGLQIVSLWQAMTMLQKESDWSYYRCAVPASSWGLSKGCEIASPTAEAVFCAAFTGIMQTKNKSCFLAGKLHLWIIILTNIGGKGVYWLILPDVFQNCVWLCGFWGLVGFGVQSVCHAWSEVYGARWSDMELKKAMMWTAPVEALLKPAWQKVCSLDLDWCKQ